MKWINFLKRLLHLQKELVKDSKEDLETYWNNKITKVDYLYAARPPFNNSKNLKVDPRIYWTLDSNLPKVRSKSNDKKALECLKIVIKKLKYTSDLTSLKNNEVWLFAFETLALMKGDCEDGAILLANMMLKSGIPYWRIRLNAGDVKGGGHAWVTYLRESDNQWYVLDWCYDPSKSLKGELWKTAEKYYSTWFSFNYRYIFKKAKLDRN